MSSILFLDPTIPDYQSLVDGLNPDIQLVILDPNQDGILQITNGLKSDVFDTVHIVSHGTSGNIQLGTTQLNSATLPNYSSLLQQWSNNLTTGADILIYGCNAAQGEVGQDFIQQLHQFTGADIAASDNATGSVVLGGDWNLEYATGNITAPLAFQVGVLEAYNSVLAPFTAGDLVVLQVGTGSSALSSAATAVFLKEFNTTGTAQIESQSIAVPTSVSGSNRALTQSGTAGSEGALNLSADGKYLTLVGYDAAPGTVAVTSTTSANNNRVVARVDASGSVDTTTRISSAYSANNIRSAVTNDGSGFWVGGPGTGLTFVTFGSTGASTTLNGLNSRVVNIFNGQLYDSSGSGSNVGVNTVGTGLPTSGSPVITLLPGLPNTGNSYAYLLLDRDAGVAGIDTLYIADQTSGLLKYSFNGATWAARGNIAGTLTGLTGVINGSNVDLYATNGTSAGNSLVKVTDTAAFNANLSGSFATLATAPTNTIFKGVAFAPTSVVTPQPDLTISLLGPNSVNVNNPFTYTLVASNGGNANASGVSVQFTLPSSGVTFNSASGTGFTAIQSSGVVTFSGGSITAGGNATLTVQVTPTATGTLTTGTAIVDPSNTIVESNETNNTASAIDTTVTAVPNTAPIIFADNETAIDPEKVTPFLSIPDSSPTGTPAAFAFVSGVINDPTDPSRTIGIEFNVSDAESTPGSLAVTATSSNPSVVNNANLIITTGANSNSRNLKINPNGVGLTDITVTVSDGSLTSSYVIKYAASAAGSASTRFLTGAANASTAIAIDANYMLVGDDENQALRLYDRNNSGLPVNSFDFTSSLGLINTSGVLREVDIEAAARVGNRIFWLGSQSNNDAGNNRPNRDRIFATDISGTGANTTLSYTGRYDFLREDIINKDALDGFGFGANFFGLATSAADGVSSKISSGYNIEGLEFAPDNTTAYVAFRAPQEPTTGRTNALIVPVTNFTSLISGQAQGSATFGAPIQLDLGGRGIREIRKNAANQYQYVIIAGPAGDATGIAPADFRLYTWTGVSTDAPVLRSADLTALNTGGSFESIVEVPNSLTNSSQLQILVDNGSTVFYNDGVAGSDLTIPNYQKSRSELIILDPVVKIHDIQGSGTTFNSSFGGTQTIEGIVTRAFLGATNLNGFYVQEEDADADNNAATSEGIFVSDPNGRFTGSIGDKVRITGTVGEFTTTSNGNNSSLTRLDISSGTVINLGASTTLPTVANIILPSTNVSDLERYEGMLVNVSASSGALTVTEYFRLGQFGQVLLSVNGASNQIGTDARLDQYTQFNAPSVAGYAAYLADIAKRQIYLDDGRSVSNPDPIIFGRGGQPLSATNTLRGGDTVASITGVLDERFEGYRIQNNTGVDFQPTNPRPVTPPAVAGSLKVGSFNVLNYFNDLDTNTDITFANGLRFEPRGANTATEFTRQRDKTINAIIATGADVLGLTEIENNGYGATSAIQDLINGLNNVAGASTYAFINPGSNSLGTDAISVAFIYKPSKVTPIGAAAFIPDGFGNSASGTSFDVVGRKPLAQTFQQNSNSQIFTAVINHFKSKGSSSRGVGDADAGDGQGLSNGTRTRQAQDLATWLATNPTGTTDPDYLLLGDFNAYAQENPLTTLATAGYSNLSPNTSYSFLFDGQFGALDHALGNSSLTAQVTGAEEWHTNADEPSVLDYNTEFKSAGQVNSLYSPLPFRSSDHDPVLVGLNLGVKSKNDFNGDRKSDIFFSDRETGANVIWLVNGTNVISQAQIPSSFINFSVKKTGDFNGDGKSDIFFNDPQSGANVIWLMDGTTVTSQALIPSSSPNFSVQQLGDFNGDGKSDIFFNDPQSGANVIWLMDSTRVASQALIPSSLTNLSVQTGDFNGDGKSDIFFSDRETGANVIWLMDGTTVTSQASIPFSFTNFTVQQTGDFNGDGKSDIFFNDPVSGGNAIWLMDGTTVTSRALIPFSSPNFSVQQLGDFNGDGKSDIFFNDPVSGGNAIWFMDGTTVTSRALIPFSSPNYQIIGA